MRDPRAHSTRTPRAKGSAAKRQRSLFEQPAQNAQPERVEGATIDEQFASFHKLNPHVYLAVVSLAREWKRKGMTHSSMDMLFHQLRINFALATRGDRWKFNNNYTACYARLVMRQEPDLAGFFELRERKAAG